jgi:cytochrome c oxidase subunit III
MESKIVHSEDLSHQFDDLQQQKESADLGMWTFLITEVLFFAGMFFTYSLYRWHYPTVYEQASREFMDLKLGSINTAVLLTSSVTMVMAVHSSHYGRRKSIVGWILATMFLGLIFLGIKAIEYTNKFKEHLVPGAHFDPTLAAHPGSQIFFSMYFCMTGLHAVHMIIGEGILATIAVMAWRGKFSSTYNNPVEVSGLYWHFVDLVWIFLFPLFYLVGSR